MAKRSRDWNEGLARDLQNPTFAREFLVAAIHEGIPLQQALGKVIRAAGVKEFAARAGVASPNVLRAINPRHKPDAGDPQPIAAATGPQTEPRVDRGDQGQEGGLTAQRRTPMVTDATPAASTTEGAGGRDNGQRAAGVGYFSALLQGGVTLLLRA